MGSQPRRSLPDLPFDTNETSQQEGDAQANQHVEQVMGVEIVDGVHI
jgi:hypothetical protein